MSSYNEITFSGSTDTISVPFPYLDKSHVQVYLNSVLLGSSQYTWPSAGQVKITAGNPAAGTDGVVRRVTPFIPIVDFTSGNLDVDDLNTADLQSLYLAEEARDGVDRLNIGLALETAQRIAADLAESLARAQADLDIRSLVASTQGTAANTFDTRAGAALANIPAAFSSIRTGGYNVAGDGGEALYIRHASMPTTPGSFQSLDGSWWSPYVNTPNVATFGAAPGGSAASLLAAFQAAIDYLPAGGGVIAVPAGDFSALVGTSLVTGAKAVTWNCGGRAVLLSTVIPGIVLSSGVYSLPEGSLQANRDVRVHNRLNMGSIQATFGTRQYGYHVEGFLHDNGTTPSELESRAYSYDLGTDFNAVVDAVRGMKGRIYVTAGQANVRGIYSFLERTSGGSHNGLMTGFLATIYTNGVLGNEMIGYRAHMDDGITAGYEVAAAKVGVDTTGSIGFRNRGGTGQPYKVSTAVFQAIGGGPGDFIQGIKDNIDPTPLFKVDNKGKALAQSFYSVVVTIADDAVATIVPPSLFGGFVKVFAEQASQTWANAYFRASGTHVCELETKGTLFDLSTAALAGTTGTDGHSTLSCNNGTLQIENRMGVARTYVCTFMNR